MNAMALGAEPDRSDRDAAATIPITRAMAVTVPAARCRPVMATRSISVGASTAVSWGVSAAVSCAWLPSAVALDLNQGRLNGLAHRSC